MQIKSQVTQTIFKRKKEFANYYATDLELGNLEQCNTRIQLISASIDHIINHLTIPHLVANKIVKQDFFLHLATDLRQAIPELADDNLTLSIGGGVIRSLIAYLYKYIHNKKLSTSLSTDDILTKFSSKKNKMFNHALVLGVGSDFDVYYQINNLDAMQTSILEPKLKEELYKYINAVETKFYLTDYDNPLKKSFLPILDLKNYQKQMELTIKQGGSHCDWLAFEVGNVIFKPNKFIVPNNHPNILTDLLFKAEYEYTTSTPGIRAEQKQTIRGCRTLVELPFTKIKDAKVLLQELQDIKSVDTLDIKSKEQIDKLVMNSNFGGANNRVYRSKPTQPLYRLAELSKEYHASNKKYLVPYFLQRCNRSNISSPPISLEKYLITSQEFIDNWTDHGILYHGTTSTTSLLCIIRNGFWVSDADLGQGCSAYGPGVYCTSTWEVAQSYTQDNPVSIVRLSTNLEYANRIINWGDIGESLQTNLKAQAVSLGYRHVFYLLRDQYSIDIIINSAVIIQNPQAIKALKNPNKLINDTIIFTQQSLEQPIKEQDKLLILISKILPLCDLAMILNHGISLDIRDLSIQDANLFTTEYNDLLLYQAVKYGNLKLVDFLVNANNINLFEDCTYKAKNFLVHVDHHLALCLAVLYSEVEIVTLLLNHPNININFNHRYYHNTDLERLDPHPNQDSFYVRLSDSDSDSDSDIYGYSCDSDSDAYYYDSYDSCGENEVEEWLQFMNSGNCLICLAVIYSTPEVLGLLLNDQRINQLAGDEIFGDKDVNSLSIYLAIKARDFDRLMVLLTQKSMQVGLQINNIFKYIINKFLINQMEMEIDLIPLMQFFLQHTSFNPACGGEIHLSSANNLRHIPLIGVGGYFDQRYFHYRHTIEKFGYLKLANNWPLIKAAQHGEAYIVELLLAHPDVNPAAYNNLALYLAALNNHIYTVELLLQDKRVNPNTVFIMAVERENVEIPILLFKDERMDYNAGNNLAIRIIANQLKTYTFPTESTNNHTESREKYNGMEILYKYSNRHISHGYNLMILKSLIESGKISAAGIQLAKQIAPQLSHVIEHWCIRASLCKKFPAACKHPDTLVVRTLEYLSSLDEVIGAPKVLLFSAAATREEKAGKILQHYHLLPKQSLDAASSKISGSVANFKI